MDNDKMIYLAMMDSECFSWYAVGDSEQAAMQAIADKWNENKEREALELNDLKDIYDISVIEMPINTAIAF